MHPEAKSPRLGFPIRYIYLDQVASTNEFAMTSLTRNDPTENICLYTYNQSSGRGQIGRSWYSDTDKNITCSYITSSPNFFAKDQFFLNQAFSLSIYDLVSAYVKESVSIKWPNDIYVGDNKIAGILIQNILRSEWISSSILGVGINVNTLEFPSDLPNPISLGNITGKDYHLLEVIHRLSSFLENRLRQLEDNKASLAEEYDDLLYRKNREHLFTIGDEKLPGIIRGVLPDGKLEVEVLGKRQVFGFREIHFVV